jgi:CRP/FNR family cyclic AMP-dependent transcriptional regulator
MKTTNKGFDPQGFLTKVGKGSSICVYRKNQAIFTQGDPADALFYIQKGSVKRTVVSSHGKEAILAISGPGDFLGEGCLAGQQRRVSTAVALADSTIVRIEKAAAIKVIREQPEFSELLVTYLLTRNIRIEEDLLDRLFNSSEKRLARVLLLLADFGKNGKPEHVIPITKISQETLAEMVGTTRARVSFFMNKFLKLGFIKYDGGLEVNSSLLSAILHD